jgi:nitroreductase
MDAIHCLKTRRSVRAYEPTGIPRSVIEDIVDCGRLAATAVNHQPWLFVAVEDRDVRRRIAAITDYGRFIADSPVCVVVFCRAVKYYLEDGSAATQNILNAATAHGLGSCWVAGDKKAYASKIAELLSVPAELKLVSLVAIGHAAERSDPPKKPLSEVLRWNRY